MEKSRCPGLRKFSIKKASEFTIHSPCTNHPLQCPLCSKKNTPAVWKFNLEQHLVAKHPKADLSLPVYKQFYDLKEEERVLLRGVLEKKQRTGRKGCPSAKLIISEGHSTRMILRDHEDEIESSDQVEEQEFATYNEVNLDKDEEDKEELDEEMNSTVQDLDKFTALSLPTVSAVTEDIEYNEGQSLRDGLRKRKRRDQLDEAHNAPLCSICDLEIEVAILLSCDCPGCTEK
ncbi:hypothetical protein C0992_008645, partial [Termitomyces sp. T32_za158]